MLPLCYAAPSPLVLKLGRGGYFGDLELKISDSSELKATLITKSLIRPKYTVVFFT